MDLAAGGLQEAEKLDGLLVTQSHVHRSRQNGQELPRLLLGGEHLRLGPLVAILGGALAPIDDGRDHALGSLHGDGIEVDREPRGAGVRREPDLHSISGLRDEDEPRCRLLLVGRVLPKARGAPIVRRDEGDEGLLHLLSVPRDNLVEGGPHGVGRRVAVDRARHHLKGELGLWHQARAGVHREPHGGDVGLVAEDGLLRRLLRGLFGRCGHHVFLLAPRQGGEERGADEDQRPRARGVASLGPV